MRFTFALCFFILQLSFGQKALTHEVFFDTDKFNIPSKEHDRLLSFLSEIEDLDIELITIYGFTDDRGSDSYNMVLSHKRANTIKEIFSSNEFDESIIINVDGKGKILLKIIPEDQVSKERGLNRKVEIIVTPIIPAPTPVVIKPKVKTTADILKGKIKTGDKIKLDNILFRTGYSYLLPESGKTLEEIAKVLVEREDIYFTIQGHVCCTQNGRDAIDRKTKKRNLSQARAEFIYNYLSKRGVNPKRMKFVGMRRKFPLGGDPKYDRRVEILITYVNASE